MITDLDRQIMRHVSGPSPIGVHAYVVPAERDFRGAGQPGPGLAASLMAFGWFLQKLWIGVEAMRARASTRRTLERLDDRLLRDIGAEPSTIAEFAEAAAQAHLARAANIGRGVQRRRAQNDNRLGRVA